MASKTNSRVGRTYVPFSSEIKTVSLRMASQDIGQWKTAIDSARSVLNPRRKLLYELFDNIKIDGHLLSVMNKRAMGITNKRILFTPQMGVDTVDVRISDLILEAPWFFDFLNYSAQAVPFGHSLIELVPATDGINIIKEVILIERANVKPERGFVAIDALNEAVGIYYKGEQADPAFAPYLIEVGGSKDYGLLMAAAQYVIYKRGGFGDWAQFAELFGMPFRVGKYNPFDDAMRKKLDTALDTMGGAGYAVIPEGASLEFFNNVQSGQSDIFKNLIEMSNAEISKLFLGQTMTTDNGSSKSQSDTHKEVEEDINLNDMIKMEYILNWDFKAKLYNISQIADLQKGKFRFPQTIHIPLEKRWEMDIALSKMIPMSEEYFYKTYGVSKPGEGETIVVPEATTVPTPPAKPAEKKKLQLKNNNITQLYAGSCKTCATDFIQLSAMPDIDKEALRLAKLIHSGKLKSGSIDQKLLKQLAKLLTEAVTEGYNIGSLDTDLTAADRLLLKKFNDNVYVFSSAKTFDELKEANKLLFDDKGLPRSFSSFKNDFIQLHETYNVQYLAAEYEHAVATSQMGAHWLRLDIEGMGKYQTAGDERVRDSHEVLNGIIQPWKSDFWKTHYPPNDWRCRCDAADTNDKTITDVKEMALPDLKPMFKGNAGIDGVIFPNKHPYFDVSEAERKKINSAAKKANE